jgi:hypothetical protein
MTSDPRDRTPESDFDNDLEAVRSAWNGLEKAEPPELLDQAVLNTARRELESRPGRWPLRWLGGFATATVIVLALSIVTQQDPQAPAPVVDETDGIKLDQSVSTAAKKEVDRDTAKSTAAPGDQAGQTRTGSEDRIEKQVQQAEPASPEASAAAELQEPATLHRQKVRSEEMPAAVAEVNAASPAIAEMMADTETEPEKESAELAEAEAWIERLMLLWETQQDEKLVVELAAFREAFPDYPLPSELED